MKKVIFFLGFLFSVISFTETCNWVSDPDIFVRKQIEIIRKNNLESKVYCDVEDTLMVYYLDNDFEELEIGLLYNKKEKKEKKIIERNSKVDNNKEEEVIVNTIQVEASLTSELVTYNDIINQVSLDKGYAFVVSDASCQPFMLNTSGAGLILTKEYYREIGYSKVNVAEHSDIAELNSLVEALVLLKSLVEFNTVEKPSKVVCFVDNVSVIRNLNTPYTQIQDPMCRRLVRVGRICINSLAKVAKDGIVIEEIHPKIDYDSRVETLLHNKCDAVCKQHRMNDGIVREVILCHSK